MCHDVARLAQHLKSIDNPQDLRALEERIRLGKHSENTFLGNLIVEMYGKCGSVGEAATAFEKLCHKNMVSWNLMMRAYVQNGENNAATTVLKRMDLEGIPPDVYTLVTALSAILVVAEGKKLHERIASAGLDKQNVIVGTALVKMFSRLGELKESERIFEAMETKNNVTLTTMVLAYATNGHIVQALQLLESVTEPSVVAWTGILECLGQSGDVQQALDVFGKMPRRDVVAWTTMLTVSCKNGHLLQARQLFERMPERTVVSFNVLLGAYVDSGELPEAELVFDMIPGPDIISWMLMFRGYVNHGTLEDVKRCFHQLPCQPLDSWNGLIAALVKHGRIHEARNLFRNMLVRNSGTWSSLILGCVRNGNLKESRELLIQMPECDCYCANAVLAGYVRAGECREALQLFHELNLEGTRKLESVMGVVFEACSVLKAQQLAQSVAEAGLYLDLVARNSLIALYGRSSRLDLAEAAFRSMPERDVVSWNSMISAYVHCQRLDLAKQMFDSSPFGQNTVACTTMVSGYARQGYITEARALFDTILVRTVVTWNAMIVGFAQNGYSGEAHDLFKQMDLNGFDPDQVSLVAALDACADIPDPHQGKLVHAELVNKGLENETVVANALINMYGKCGRVPQAQSVFENLLWKGDVVTWTSIITAYSQNGYFQEPIRLFMAMVLEGVEPNNITVVSILSACSHTGVEGWECFLTLQSDYGFQPQTEHFACMIDHLGRAGWFQVAEELVDAMPYEPDSVAKTALAAYKCSDSDIITQMPFSFSSV